MPLFELIQGFSARASAFYIFTKNCGSVSATAVGAFANTNEVFLTENQSLTLYVCTP